jgi:hypothetical protein
MPSSTKIRRRIRLGLRSTTLLAVVAVVGLFVGDTEAVRTLLVACQAAFATTAIATVTQWAYTALNFTDSRIGYTAEYRNDDDYSDELIIAARIRTLGMVYIGTAIVVGLVYFATYRGAL